MDYREDPRANHIGAQYATEFKGNQALLAKAEMAASESKAMTKRETIKVYKKAVLWSMVLSTALVMEGYDVAIVSEFCRRCSYSRSTASLDKIRSWRDLELCRRKASCSFLPIGNLLSTMRQRLER